jgi:hypothetical protein
MGVNILAKGCTELKRTRTTSLDQMARPVIVDCHFTVHERGDSCNGLANDSQRKSFLAARAHVSQENCSSYFFPTFPVHLLAPSIPLCPLTAT